jgi:hypothetical protein
MTATNRIVVQRVLLLKMYLIPSFISAKTLVFSIGFSKDLYGLMKKRLTITAAKLTELIRKHAAIPA